VLLFGFMDDWNARKPLNAPLKVMKPSRPLLPA